MLSNGSVTPGYVFTPDMLKMFSPNANLHILSGTDQWISWWPGQYSPFITDLVILATIALPAILIIGLWLARKGKGNLRLFYILIGTWIVSFFLALGWNNPIYTWLATAAPLSSSYGWLLRVPGKISYLLWPAYAVATGLVVQSTYLYCSSKKNILRKRVLVLTAVAVLLIASTGYSVIKAEDYFNYYYAPVPVPSAYQQAFSYISNNLTNARIADLARYENGSGQNNINYNPAGHPQPFESSYTWNPHRIAGYFVPRSISAPNIGSYHFTYSGTWEPAYAHFQDNVTYQYWSDVGKPWESNVNVSRLENVNASAVSWFPVYGVNYILYHNDIYNTTGYAQHDLQLLNQTGCQLVQQWGDYIYLYHVPQTFGRIYTLNATWEGNPSTPPTAEDVNASGASIYDITQVDVTHWELNINATKPFSLIFTEGFDSYWAATLTTNGHSSVVNSQNIFGSINSFPINQTGVLHISIQYKPQTWLYYGITVSILFLIAISIALIFFLLKRKEQ